MRWFRLFAGATGATLTLAACGGGGSVAIGDPPLPSLTTASDTPSKAPSTYAPHHHARSSSARTATPTRTAPSRASSVPTSARPSATTPPATHGTSPTRSASPSHRPAPSPTSVSCAGVSGSTTTIQEQTGDKFVPATVSISRCDSVRAVDTDATAAHTFTGPGWDSGQMTTSSNSSYTVRFMSTGTFHFYCTNHKSFGMTGTITVT